METPENSEELYSDTFTEEDIPTGEEECLKQSSKMSSPSSLGQLCAPSTSSEDFSSKTNVQQSLQNSESDRKRRKSISIRSHRRTAVDDVWYHSFNQTLENVTPKKILLRAKRKAKTLARKGESDSSLREFIRCIALARIVYGDEHWRLAEAQVSLAEAYLDLKDYGVQALDHSESARDVMLLRLHSPQTEKKKADILRLLVRIYLTMGRAQSHLKKYSESEQNLLKAERLTAEFCKMNSVSKEKANTLYLKVTKALARMYFGAKKYDKAVSSFRNVLSSVEECFGVDDARTIPVHQDLGHSLQYAQRKTQEEALDHFRKALQLASKYFSQQSEEVALAEFALAKAYLTTTNEEFYDLAEDHLQNALDHLKSVHGTSHPLYLEIEDQFIQFLIRLGREEEAAAILKAMIPRKCVLFGEGSYKVIHSYKLLSSLFMAVGDMEEAAKTLRKCLDLEIILYGSTHKYCRLTQHTLNIILENPSVSKKLRHRDSLKNRPAFVSTVVSRIPVGH